MQLDTAAGHTRFTRLKTFRRHLDGVLNPLGELLVPPYLAFDSGKVHFLKKGLLLVSYQIIMTLEPNLYALFSLLVSPFSLMMP